MSIIPRGPGPLKTVYTKPAINNMGRNWSLAASASSLRTGQSERSARLFSTLSIAQKLIGLNESMSSASSVCGLNSFLYNEFSLSSYGRAITKLRSDDIRSIDQALEVSSSRRVERQAYILRNYLDFYSMVSSGEVELVNKEGFPDYVEAVGIEKNADMSGYVILFKNGYCTRTKMHEGLDLRKSGWEMPYTQFDPKRFLCHFIDRMIHARESGTLGDTDHDNAVYIKCSLSYLEELSKGRLPGRNRTWFSLSLNYARGFKNKGKTLNGRARKDQRMVDLLSNAGFIAKDPVGNWIWKVNPFDESFEADTRIQELAEKMWQSDPSN